MNWKKLFAIHILERGYDYYIENESSCFLCSGWEDVQE